MLDLGLTKLAVIGIVALVVIGPERLPKVARTVGTLLGRAQRYVADLKSQVSREMDLAALKQMQANVRAGAQTFENSLHAEMTQTEQTLRATMHDVADQSTVFDPDHFRQVRQRASAKRKNWRTRQRATPLWFRQVNVQRMRVLSGAARVARYRADARVDTTRTG